MTNQDIYTLEKDIIIDFSGLASDVAELCDLARRALTLERENEELRKEVVRKEEEFISTVSHLEAPHHCQITEPGKYIHLIKVERTCQVTMFQKVTEPVLAEGEEALYPCREWREFRKDKKPWPIIPFKDYADYRKQTGQAIDKAMSGK